MLDNYQLAQHYFSQLSAEERHAFCKDLSLIEKTKKPQLTYIKKRLPPEFEDSVLREMLIKGHFGKEAIRKRNEKSKLKLKQQEDMLQKEIDSRNCV